MSSRILRVVGLGIAAVVANSCSFFSPDRAPHPLDSKWEKERTWLHQNVQSVLFCDYSGFVGTGSYKITAEDLKSRVVDDYVERQAWLGWAAKNNVPIPGNEVAKNIQNGGLHFYDGAGGQLLRSMSFRQGSDIDLGPELFQDLQSAQHTGLLVPNPQPPWLHPAKLQG